ncbi:MAG: ATP-binding cassette domain-containing protein [Bacilli bacterium]|nr:ATP-binding cassette domain-containing protein [Bacilli bacterium]
MEIVYDKVTHIYNSATYSKLKVLDDISLNIEENKITGIIGRQGSGKTTLVEMLSALVVPTKGSVKVDEYLIKKNKSIKKINELRKKVGIVFQFPEDAFFNLTVEKEIEFGIKNLNYKTDDINKRISDSLKLVGLDDKYKDRNPKTLSNGEKRKLALACVLAYNPSIIVFDEPTIGLDNIARNSLIKLIINLKKKYNKTIIIITHDVDLLLKIGDNVIVLDEGKIVCMGSKYDVFTNNDLNKYDIGIPKIIEFEKKVLDKKGIKLGYRDNIDDLLKDIYRNVR